ncbi:MAG: hypothetical protein J6A01_06640 [Proteobacteria bacterium]|nr:hypothetical protein [Pseudomonadota bacterium]
MLASHPALAKDECPEGYVSFVNSETYQSVCLPVGVEKTQTPEANAEVQEPEAKAEVQEPEAKAEEESGQTESAAAEENNEAETTAATQATQPVEQPQQPAPTQPNSPQLNARPYPIVPATVPAYQPAPQDYAAYQTADTNSYYDEVRQSGWLLELGFGYGMIGNADFKFMTGWHFGSNDNVASFGLYLDADLRVGWYPPFSMDWTLDPTLHVTVNSFRFSVGIGIGIFSILKEKYEDYLIYDSENSTSTGMRTLFEIKPTVAFDWYMTGNVFFGFGFSVPLIFLTGSEQYDSDVFVQPWFNIDCHFGYKF